MILKGIIGPGVNVCDDTIHKFVEKKLGTLVGLSQPLMFFKVYFLAATVSPEETSVLKSCVLDQPKWQIGSIVILNVVPTIGQKI